MFLIHTKKIAFYLKQLNKQIAFLGDPVGGEKIKNTNQQIRSGNQKKTTTIHSKKRGEKLLEVAA